jgi:hypothetical protein
MSDAIRALRLLAQTKCRGSTGTGKPQREVAP